MHYVVQALNSVVFLLPSGVAIQMTEAVYAAPSLNAELTDAIFLQNLPSIVASYVLNPQPGEIVLDMCAAPGIKHYYTNYSTQTVYHTHMAAEGFSSRSDWLRESKIVLYHVCILVTSCLYTSNFMSVY